MIVASPYASAVRYLNNIRKFNKYTIHSALLLYICDSTRTLAGWKMQSSCILAIIIVLFTSTTSALQMTDFQLERTLADRGTMQRHIKCALGEGPCDPVGIRLRTLAPLVLRGSCPQCSAQETRQIRRTLAFVQRNYPWEWAKIVRQYG